MRIGIIVPGGVDPGGRERVVPVFLNLIERLAQRHQVVVFALHQQPAYARYELLGSTVVNIGRTPGLPPGARFVDRLLRLALNIFRESPRFDVLHACFASEPGALAVAVGKCLRIPVVTSSLGGEFVALPHIRYGEQRTSAGRAIVRFALRFSDIVTVPSRSSAAQCPRSGAYCIPMGIDCRVFSPPAARASGPPFRLLHVASVNRVKDQPTLLRAFRLLVDRGLDVQLEIVGEDTLGGAIQRLAAELQIEHRVRFRGFVPNDELVSLYREAHLYVHSSLHEGMPVSALEAAACGLPLVGTAVGLFRELAPHGAIGVAPGDHRALADAIASALVDDPLRRRVADAALHFARTHDADWTARQFETLYSTCVQRAARTAARAETLAPQPEDIDCASARR